MPERYVGKTLGKYRIDQLLGSGGFAWVYKAYDPELDINVALKILKPQYGGDPKFETRFKREASTAAKLRHPNIVKIYAVGTENGAVYFAMDFLPSGLADKLDVMGTVPESMLVRTAIDVASALAYAHREGIIHRDIKTDNIMYDEHGNAVVADFGIAKAVSGYVGETGTDMVVGTPQYFSPEQARALPLDGRADLYSLGVTLFKAATGTLPFSGNDWYEVARQQVEEKPPKPRSLNPAISKDFERIILTLLEKNPDERYANGEALCEDLVQHLHNMGESPPVRTLQMPAATPSHSRSPLPRVGLRGRKLRRHARWLIPAVLVLAIIPIAFMTRDGESVGPPPATAASTTRTGAATKAAAPAPTPKSLTITSPRTASVTLNGKPIPSGTWRTDTIAPGTYQVAATVDAPRDCRTATARGTITVRDTGASRLTVEPKSCGRLTVDADPNGLEIVLKMSGERTITVTSPVREPLLLTAGTWTAEANKSRCVPLSKRVVIPSNGRETLRLRPFCQ